MLAVVLLGLNLPLYRFFRSERGLRFALATIPWHWLYYTYNGLSVVLGAWAYFRPERRTAEHGHKFEAGHETESRVAA